jgi:hypothetical protein
MPKAYPRFCAVLALFLVAAVLDAQESHELRLANLYYDENNYYKASTHFQNLILQSNAILSGEIFYRYAYSWEQIRGLDEGVLEIYTLARYYFEQEDQSNSRYALSAGAKLKNTLPLEPDDAAALLTKLRTGIEEDRKARFYSRVDRLYDFFSQFSLLQWKIIVSLFMTIPFFIGILVLRYKERGSSIGHHS